MYSKVLSFRVCWTDGIIVLNFSIFFAAFLSLHIIILYSRVHKSAYAITVRKTRRNRGDKSKACKYTKTRNAHHTRLQFTSIPSILEDQPSLALYRMLSCSRWMIYSDDNISSILVTKFSKLKPLNHTCTKITHVQNFVKLWKGWRAEEWISC